MNKVVVKTPKNRSPIDRVSLRVVPFAAALIFHIFLLCAFLSSRSLPVKARQVFDVSLVSGFGEWPTRFKPAAPPSVDRPLVSLSQSSPSTAPPVAPEPATPAKAAEDASLKPVVRSQAVLDPMVAILTKAGPVLTAEPLLISAPPPQVEASLSNAPGGKSCDITSALQASLQSSLDVKTALSLVPASSRSVANAILLWNGDWIAPGAVGGSLALTPIEKVVGQTIGQSSPSCQGAIVRGVRFVILSDARDTVVLAFGSSVWRWSDVIPALRL